MFQRAMGVIFEMILAECGRSSAADQKEASAQMQKTIATLPSTEFPNLLREAIVAETVQAGAAKPSPEVAAEYASWLWPHSAPTDRSRYLPQPLLVRPSVDGDVAAT